MDWRGQIKANQRKTRWVIIAFIALYLAVGLLVDVAVLTTYYPREPLSILFKALVTFRVTPYATLLMAAFTAISLLITYALYDKIMLLGTDYSEIDPQHFNTMQEQQLYNVVEEMKVAAGLKYMPRVYIIEADYMNAFASGYSEKSSMVCITRGLMVKLTRSEMQAVMAHELSHIRHLDIKLTLTVAVLTNILLIVVDMLFYNLLFSRRDNRDNNQNVLVTVVIVLRYVLPIVTGLLALFLSRTREYMADAGCVELMRDNGPLASALIKIDTDYQQNAEHYDQEYSQTAHEDVRRSAYLFDPASYAVNPVKSFSSLFSTHPSTSDRLRALGIKPHDH
jgi:heat shock protein HtpX